MNFTTQLVITGVSSLAVGGLAGYFISRNVLEAKYEAIAQNEIAAVKDYYKIIRKDGIRPEDLVRGQFSEMDVHTIDVGRNAIAMAEQLGYSTPETEADDVDEPDEAPSASEVRPDVEPRKMTIEEAQEIDTFDEVYQHMIANRSKDEPYIITIDEFMSDEGDYEKQSLNYYQGDDTLTDSRDIVIPEIEETVGVDALTKFGLYSKDTELVYVRNDRKKMDFEICRNMNTYVEAVAGFRDPKVVRKMREDD